jgi:ankyrin repeat protein
LHHAAKKGHKESLETLLKLGSNLYSQDLFLKTALHHAAFNGIKILKKDIIK